jgi:hypothetical protein
MRSCAGICRGCQRARRPPHTTAQDIIAEPTGHQAVFTGFLDRSVLYGVLAHIEMLGLDLVEVQRVTKTERHPAPRNPA